MMEIERRGCRKTKEDEEDKEDKEDEEDKEDRLICRIRKIG